MYESLRAEYVGCVAVAIASMVPGQCIVRYYNNPYHCGDITFIDLKH